VHALAQPDEGARRRPRRAQDLAGQVRGLVAQGLEQGRQDPGVVFAADLLDEDFRPVGTALANGLEGLLARALVADLSDDAAQVRGSEQCLRGKRFGLLGRQPRGCLRELPGERRLTGRARAG